MSGQLNLALPAGGSVTIAAPNSASDTTVTLPAGNSTLATTVDAGNFYNFKNRIINGDMRIDQRNNGASINPSNGQYSLDRWRCAASVTSKYTVQQNVGSVLPPVGFLNYLGITSSSAYSVGSGDLLLIQQYVEGYNVADLGWGTANAQSVTLSFWVRSSLTGTFGGSLQNADRSRCYPFTYSISAANTWEQKTVTIVGDTSGTWVKNNGIGIQVNFGLGVGSSYLGTAGAWSSSTYFSATSSTNLVATNAATMYITGVQLEKGSTASSFDYRDYSRELATCQRYYYKVAPTANNDFVGFGQVATATAASIMVQFPVTMRTVPASLDQTGTASNYKMSQASTAQVVCTAVPTINGNTSEYIGVCSFTASTLGGTAGQITQAATDGTGYLGWNAEL